MSTSDHLEAAKASASLSLALLMLPVSTACVMLHESWPLAITGVIGLALLWWRLRAFGNGSSWLPNSVTFARVVLTAMLAYFGPFLSGAAVALWVFGLFAMDGVDGLLARRYGGASPLGAHLDMESDGFLVMVTCVLLVLRGHPAWVLIAGYLRYAYVVVIQTTKAHGEAPRSRFGRYVFALSLNGMALAYLPLGALARVPSAIAILLLCWSFGRSFYWSFRAAS